MVLKGNLSHFILNGEKIARNSPVKVRFLPILPRGKGPTGFVGQELLHFISTFKWAILPNIGLTPSQLGLKKCQNVQNWLLTFKNSDSSFEMSLLSRNDMAVKMIQNIIENDSFLDVFNEVKKRMIFT